MTALVLTTNSVTYTGEETAEDKTVAGALSNDTAKVNLNKILSMFSLYIVGVRLNITQRYNKQLLFVYSDSNLATTVLPMSVFIYSYYPEQVPGFSIVCECCVLVRFF